MLANRSHPFLNRISPHIVTLAFYAALTFIALDNLVLRLSTAIPGKSEWHDYAIFYWNLWWVKYALFNLHRDPMFSNYVLYPHNVNLSLHTFTFALALFTAPLQQVLDLKLILNGAVAGSFILSGYLMFLFLRGHIRNDGLAALGGALFAFTPTAIYRAEFGDINLVQTGWLPLALLLWDAVIAQRAARSRLIAAAALGLTLYFTWTTDAQFMLWLAMLLPPYALYTWLARCRGRERLRVLGLVLVTSAFMLGPALVEPIPAILQTRGMAFPRAELSTAQAYSYQLSWLVFPDPDRLGDTIGQLIPLLTLLCVPLACRRRERWLWLALGLASFILALGPFLHGTEIALPYLSLHELLGGQYRTPVRFTTPATLALITFIALSLDDFLASLGLRRWQPWLIGAATVALVLDSRMLAPFSVTFVPDYRIYHEIGRDSAEYALLEVPVAPASGYAEFGHAQDLQFYSYIHHKQIINGTVSRIPSDWLDRYRRSPLLSALTGEYNLPPLDDASRELDDRLNRWNMRYVLVHRARLTPERARAIVQFLNIQPFLCPVDEEGDLLSYRRISQWSECTRPEMSALPAGTTQLNLGQPESERYLGSGWYNVENIGGPQGRWAGEIVTSSVRLVPPSGTARFRFRALAYPDDQAVTILVNGHQIANVKLVGTWADYEVEVPVEVWRADGPSIVTLVHARVESAFEHTGGASPDKRPLAAAYEYLVFEPARK